MQPSQEQTLIVDWINSINDPYCLLVNSLWDLEDGVVLCHLVAQSCCNEEDSFKMRQLVNYDNLHQDIRLRQENLSLALNVF